MAFPGWLAVIAETPQKRRTAFSSFFFTWLPVNKNTFFKKRQPYLFFLVFLFFYHRSCFRRIYNVANITEKKVLENEVIE